MRWGSRCRAGHRFRAPKPEHVEFWKDCAARYANHPAVIFDLFNEPHGISWEVWRNGGWVGEQGKHDESAFLTEEEKKKNQGFESVGRALHDRELGLQADALGEFAKRALAGEQFELTRMK